MVATTTRRRAPRRMPAPVLAVAALAAAVAAGVGVSPAVVLRPAQWQARFEADPTSAVDLAAASMLWLLAGWLSVGVLVTLAARLPGLPGRVAAHVAAVATPRRLRQLVNAAVGASLLVAATAPTAALATPVAASVHPAAASAGSVAASTGSVAMSARPAATTESLPPQPSLPQLGEPAGPVTESAPTTPAPVVATTPSPEQVAHPSAPPHRDRMANPAPPSTRLHAVQVEPGDSLWSLADRGLGGHADEHAIAATWPLWWAANRAAIGNDPDLILPGTVLQPPAA